MGDEVAQDELWLRGETVQERGALDDIGGSHDVREVRAAAPAASGAS